MAEKQIFLTPEGRAKLEAELDNLKTVRRSQVAEAIHSAKEEGDIMENSAYDEAKNEQAFRKGRSLTVETMIRHAQIIDEGRASDTVRLGSTVTVVDEDGFEETYTIVGSAEADPRKGRISNESPVGRALLGKRKGDTVVVHVPAGDFSYKIIEIS